MTAPRAARENPPWLFGLLSMPAGMASTGVLGLLVPYVLRQHGVAVDRISEVAAAALIPLMWTFLGAPIVNLGLPRRIWLLLCSAISALLAGASILLSAGSLGWLTVVLFISTIVGALCSAAAGGLMSGVQPGARGRASGFYQAGNIGAGALGGGLLVWCADRVSLPWLAVITTLLVFLPSLGALWIFEVEHSKLTIGPAFGALFHDVKEVLRSKRTWLGLLFFLSPSGSGALGNLISSIGPDYHASGDTVAFITGAGGGLWTAIGCIAGGWICDRIHRTTAYGLFGLLAALCSLWMYLGPASTFTYAGGYSAYSLATGLAYAGFSSLVLEILGTRPRGASTAYALMNSAGNIPVIYMTALDGWGYGKGGARGLMLTDALIGGIAALILLALATHFQKRWSAQAPA